MSSGDDPAYLRDVQYKDSAHLASRANLHAKYGTASIGWFEFVAGLVDWNVVHDVLDVGCGSGLIWPAISALLSRPVKVTLVDLSPGMVTEARARADALANVDVVRAEVADAQALPFADDAFDVVLANHMLYHVPDRLAAVAELARVLRPDGVLVAATNGENSLREITELRPSTPEYAKRFGRENGASILGARFDDVEWHGYADELRCTDADDVVAYIASMAPGEIDDVQAAALRDRVRQRMIDGVFRVTKDTGAFTARPASGERQPALTTRY